jgi:hypothetical protein
MHSIKFFQKRAFYSMVGVWLKLFISGSKRGPFFVCIEESIDPQFLFFLHRLTGFFIKISSKDIT